MRVLLQTAIVFALWVLGEFLSRSLGLPIPGGIIGMILLFILLSVKVIHLEWIEQVGDLLLDNMGILFVPIGVSLLTMAGLLSRNLLALAIIIPAGMFTVMGVSGLVVQWLAGKEHD